MLTYKEGGSLDFLVEYGDLTMLFKASASYVPGALDGIEVDALFIGTATLSKQTPEFKDAFANEVIEAVRPSLVVPTHWNDFFTPLTDDLPLNRRFVDNTPERLRELQHRSAAIGADFVILNGYDRIILGGDRGCGPTNSP
jgi:L-ascorbate metabolism protein UlaG (beta-lactamase superfamily)